VGNKNEKKQLGICDVCGEYSDELVCIEGEWVCDSCRE